ncbi:unnamed protein product [Rotaria sp. Silwood2]|nr:unnamed protein product [Rotaria sp. Silwood2]CAF2604557.1 unnamed protein product [Rotaria sp. Silwood2]CAF2830051.1 unnamed protein product [Rotaria sp. Silwood2]CAF2974485.1 unnamed protein product [Rotaria sp. Silwood2]CAF4131761.1 unnamed protein product [Rotaria sp. Silwood2]
MVDNSGRKENRLCIVSLIGKSTLFEQQCNKSWKLNQLIQIPAFKEHSVINNEDDFEYYYDHLNNTIYIHLRSFHDTYQLLHLIDNINDDTSIKNFAHLWENKQANFIKKSLICFLLSHIIIISHSSHTFDLNYLRFFRIIELLRHKTKPAVLEAIRSLNILKDADINMHDGRLCVPRALFIFENHHHKGNDTPGGGDRDDDQKLINMAQNLEDIIFNALRCSYIISNQINSALFTIAHKQPFVFIHRCYKESSSLGQTQKLLGILQGFVKQTKDSSSNSNIFNRSNTHQQDDAQAFKRFLFRHIEEALTDGWSNDGISGGARSESSSFELCTYSIWINLFNSVRELFETIPATNKIMRQAFGMLRANIDPDGKLNETRCKKYLPMAIKYYEDGLPSRYTQHFHEQRLQATIEFFATYARGSSSKRYVQQLSEQCTRLWHDGRQLCEAISLTRNPCKNELHRVPGEEDSNDSANLAHLPVRAHNSKIQLMAASNCGQILQEREDPFDLKEANYDFYQDVNKMLSGKPIYFEFPIFRGTVTSTEIRAYNNPKIESKLSKPSQDLSGASDLSQSKSVALYSPVPDDEQQALDNITGDKSSERHKSVTCADDEQPIPSTTEYLDGMTHSDSPPGLLPRYSSWSLCCIGRASDYIPTKGLQQPGFLTNLNHLIPWDINPHNNQTSAANAAGGGGGGGGVAQYHQQRTTATRSYKNNRRGATSASIWDVTIRVYIGCEYECPRGHRFMCSSPNHVIRVVQNGIVKDDGAKLVRSDMPLYTPCSCRILSTGARVWAQLMRAYVVTPSSSTPIQCVLHPQVVPAGPNSPTFFPSYTQPIHLTEDSIWILRFPFIYHDGEKPLYRPQNEEDLAQCLVLRDLFSWTNKS